MATGLLVLLGWAMNAPILTSLHPAWATMRVNTAVCFVLLGASLWLFGDSQRVVRRRMVTALALTVLAIAAATLSQDVLGWNLGIDELLFVDRAPGARPGRMAPNTAILLLLLGMGVVRLDDVSMGRLSAQWYALVASAIALVAIAGYLYGVDALYSVPGFGSLSLYSALSALVVATSILAAQPRGGLMLVVSANTVGGMLARRLLPVIVVAPIALGWLRLVGEQRGFYGEAFGLALFAVSNVFTIGTIAWFTTRKLIESEFGRQEAYHDLAEHGRQLSTTLSSLRAAEQTRHQSQQLFQAISDNAPAVIYAKDLEGRYLFVNRRFTDLFHVEFEGIIGKTDHDLFSPEEANRFRDMDRRVAQAGVALTEEEYVPLADGVRTYLSVKCPLWDDVGRIYAVFGISTDVTDRKRAAEALRANEERTRLIIESALDAVITIDAAGVITGWSPQAERAFGWTRREATGRELAETIVPDAYRNAHRSGLQRFLATGEGPALNRRLELSALHRDGHEFPIELSITPVEAGGNILFSAFVRDITDRKRTEQSLLESQQHYQALAESLPHLVWTCRPDGYCDFLSRQWVDYTGRSAEEQLGYGWAEQLHPDDRARAQEEWSAATVRGDTFDIEFRIRRKDGAYRWFKTRAVPLRNASGKVVKWFGSNTDFDDYKQSEQRLQAQLERLSLLDRLTRAIGERQDLNSVLEVVTRSLEDQLPLDFSCLCLYDRADESLTVARVGMKSEALALELALPENARIPIDRNGLSRCIRGQLVHEPDTAHVPFPFPQRLAHGGLRSLVVAPLAVESSVFGVLIAARRRSQGFSSAECEFLRQLSEHVALAAHQAELYTALQRAYDDLRQTQHAVMQQERLKALGEMASGIAHDINNAISPVALYTESLLETERNLSVRARDQLAIIQGAIGDVAQTVARMREFYREREPQLTLAPVDVNRIIRDVVELTRARWNDMPQRRGVVIRASIQLEPRDPTILAVASELREALTNLVFNAVDAMPDGGTMTLRTRTAAGREGTPTGVHIEVSDTGVGMDADTRRRCMEPFFTTKGERGTGLGLAMVYGIVQRHSAEIEIDSTPGQGTTVRLIFALPSAVVGDGAPADAPDVRRHSRLRILLVDDDPVLLNSLRDVLEGDGHLVTAASGGQAGIDAFRTGHQQGRTFNVVITDLGMPYVDGRHVATAIKEVRRETPVILLTGWGQRLIDDGDAPPHVDRVLNKPTRLSELRRALFEVTSDGHAS